MMLNKVKIAIDAMGGKGSPKKLLKVLKFPWNQIKEIFFIYMEKKIY